MSNINQQREAVKNAYRNSTSWQARVGRMSDSQIQAIYIRLKNEGKL